MTPIGLLLAFATALSLLFLLVFGLVYLTRKTYEGFLEWTLAMGFYALGGLTFALAPWNPVTLFLANLITLTGTLLMRRGVIRFRGRPVRRTFELVLLVVFLLMFGAFSLEPGNATPRVVLYSVFVGVVWASATVITLTRRPPHFGSADWLLAINFAVLMLFSLARAWFAWQSGSPLPALKEGGSFNVTMVFLQVLTLPPMALALLGMNSQRIEHELRTAQQALEADVAERLRSEARLRESEQRLQRAQEGAGVGIWELDLATGQTYRSPECARLCGLDPRVPVSDAEWRARLLPEDRARIDAEGMAAVAERRPFEAEYRVRLPSGEERWLLTKGDVQRDERDSPVRLVGINIDITDRKHDEMRIRGFNEALEDRVRQRTAELEASNQALVAARDAAEAANRAKSAFLANMSHELRTPLSAIIGMVHLARKDAKDERLLDRLSKADQAARHLLGVIGDILDLSRIEADRLELADAPFRLSEVRDKVLSVMGSAAELRGLSLSFDLPESLAHQTWRGDALRLSQVLLNLSGNAIKFTSRGSVRIACARLDEEAGGCCLRFEVRDTGDGIAPEDQRRLFTPFEQVDASPSRRHGGTGLGLSISRLLVEKMGGQIGVDSEPGQGSTFWFTVRIPAVPAEPGTAPVAA